LLPGDTASAVKRTWGAPDVLHALTVVVSEVKFSFSGALTTVAAGFCAPAGIELIKAAKASGAAYSDSRVNLFNICTPCGETVDRGKLSISGGFRCLTTYRNLR